MNKFMKFIPFFAAPTIALALLPALSHAAGMEYPDNGTIAIGRGGAWAANPSDGLAFQYNPAGLAQQRGLHLYLDGRLTQENLRFASSTKDALPVENSGPLFLGPSGAVVWGMGPMGPLSDLAFALGATGPSAIGKTNFPESGAQRYAITNTDYFIAYFSGAVAGAYKDWLRFGITGQMIQANAKFGQHVWSPPEGDTYEDGKHPPEFTTYDAIATFSGQSGFVPSFVAGLTIIPHADWAIGVSFRPHVHFDAPGKLVIDLPEYAAKGGVKVEGDSANLRLDLSDTLRTGVQWQATPTLQLELDGVVERWSRLQTIQIINNNIMVGYPNGMVKIDDIIFQKQFVDAYSLRLGGDFYALPDRLKLRAGYIFETSAINKPFVSIDFANWQRHVASAGLSVRLFGAWLDLAYAHHFVAQQVVTDSQVVSQVGATLPGFVAPVASPIGNGTYDASLNIFSMSLRIPFGDVNGRL